MYLWNAIVTKHLTLSDIAISIEIIMFTGWWLTSDVTSRILVWKIFLWACPSTLKKINRKIMIKCMAHNYLNNLLATLVIIRQCRLHGGGGGGRGKLPPYDSHDEFFLGNIFFFFFSRTGAKFCPPPLSKHPGAAPVIRLLQINTSQHAFALHRSFHAFSWKARFINNYGMRIIL